MLESLQELNNLGALEKVRGSSSRRFCGGMRSLGFRISGLAFGALQSKWPLGDLWVCEEYKIECRGSLRSILQKQF